MTYPLRGGRRQVQLPIPSRVREWYRAGERLPWLRLPSGRKVGIWVISTARSAGATSASWSRTSPRTSTVRRSSGIGSRPLLHDKPQHARFLGALALVRVEDLFAEAQVLRRGFD